ncbi:MAG: TIGR04076 family protein [Candidatus Bathyarchaeota archaeon]|nr:TIGR04076 family protein [Candidatus Bathyarchaeota archaeon]
MNNEVDNMPIVVTVKGGKCMGGHHKVGDRWEIESVTPEGMCLGAWGAVFPYVMVLSMKGEFSWEKVPSKIPIHCPDPEGITLEVERIET